MKHFLAYLVALAATALCVCIIYVTIIFITELFIEDMPAVERPAILDECPETRAALGRLTERVKMLEQAEREARGE